MSIVYLTIWSIVYDIIIDHLPTPVQTKTTSLHPMPIIILQITVYIIIWIGDIQIHF